MRCPEEEAPQSPVAPREGNRAGAEGAAEPEGVDDPLWNRKSLAAARR